MTIQIIKKDKSLQNFNPKKIIEAIRKSADRACVKLNKAQEKAVVDYVCKFLIEHGQDEIDVGKLHNIVECALDTVDSKVAKCYRDYRNYKINFFSMIDKVYQKKLSLTFIADRSNANADSALVTTQKAIVYNELNTEFYKKFFLNEEERKASEEGYIYIHDKNARLDTMNCCIFDMENLLKGGFKMGNLQYNEPKSLDVAFDLMCDVAMNAASAQYGGFTIPEVDKLLGYYAEKSYSKYVDEFNNICTSLNHSIDTDAANKYAYEKVKRDIEQGVQGMEMKFNSVASSRGDYPFTAVTFGLGTNRLETLISSTFLKVRKEGQGKEGFKRSVLFPKLSFFYDDNLHGEGKELEWLFNEAIDCSSKSMYPDFISLDAGYPGNMYKKYKTPISRMGCRAQTSPWYIKGGIDPANKNDKPVYNGRFNMGAVALNFPMIVAKAKEKGVSFYRELDYYLELVRGLHKKTVEFLSHKKAGINPLGFCEGGFIGGCIDPDKEIGKEFLKPMTISFGIIALNEASVLQTGKSIAEDDSFAVDVLNYINDYVNRIKYEDDILYAVYGVPGETAVGTLRDCFVKKYGIIERVSDKPYFTNSFHCAVYEDITPIQKQDQEFRSYHLCNGGNIQYCRYPVGYNIEAMKSLVRRAMQLGYYEGVNLSLNYCNKCGHQWVDGDTCPKCGTDDTIQIQRMNGYLGYSKIHGKTMYNDTKMQEFKDRISM